ncbi:DUF5348 domain-containing protein [Planococcus sp. CP5-4]|uniref:DUF5348 domain-containing protein n=1 Tax=unclassified Planococcus (in: firmicutes) TaxID=2662419 RepID=UPI0027E4F958|nr:DUF5348 domain-containing protein [Planococcus sp. CP5-4]
MEEAKRKLSATLPGLKGVAKEEKFEHDLEDPEQRFEEREIRKIADHLYGLIYSIEYLQKPIRFSGKIVKRPDGRYEIEQTEEFFISGSPIEIWKESEEIYERTRIEHDGTDYFAVGIKQPLAGLQARCR